MLILLLDLLAAVLGVLHSHLCVSPAHRYSPVTCASTNLVCWSCRQLLYVTLIFSPLFLFLFNLEFENLLLSVPSVLSCSFLLSIFSILLFSTLLPRGIDRVEHNRIYKQLSFSFSMWRHKADFSRNPNFPEIYLINYQLFIYKAFNSKIESLTSVFRFRFLIWVCT